MTRHFIAAVFAAIASANDAPDNCCQFFNSSIFIGTPQEFCVGQDQVQTAYSAGFDFFNTIRSARCGTHAAAKLCTGKVVLGPVEGQDDPKFDCMDLPGDFIFDASSEYAFINFQSSATLIINDQPWVAKGPHYLSLDRSEKSKILWNKIRANEEMTTDSQSISTFDIRDLFDEFGDENDCRRKAAHANGSVGKAVWVDLGGHPYTGMFKGADTGFIRLATVGGVNDKNDSEPLKMDPSISLKFLRDGIDSGNISANHSFRGQPSFNFFENSISTVQRGDRTGLDFVHRIFKGASDFVGGLGNSEFASFEQDGTEIRNPVFPFQLIFEPTGDINMPADTYDETIFEFFAKIEPHQVLYRVWALAEPTDLTVQHIANIFITTDLRTSKWGDENMYFRHTRLDDDIRRGKPDWGNHVFAILTDVDGRVNPGGEPIIQPQISQRASACPLSFLWD